LLLCERTDQIQQPSGRLLRILPIPIDQNERTVEVTFEVTEHLALNVWASGRVAKTIQSETRTTIHDLNLSFEMPEEAARLWAAPQNIAALA